MLMLFLFIYIFKTYYFLVIPGIPSIPVWVPNSGIPCFPTYRVLGTSSGTPEIIYEV